MRPFARWSLPSKLALVAFALGLAAVFGDPYGGGAVTIHPQELAAIVQKEADHVAVDRLADWILQKRSDYRLIDLRDAASFAAYHIPTAENVAITDLPGTLARNEKIVLYSDGGIHAAQAWFLLQAKGYGAAYILRGGLDEWKDQILYPVLPANATVEQRTAFERRKQVSAFFGGAPRLAATQGAQQAAVPTPLAEPALPKVQAPAAPAGPGMAAAPKKKKEGC